MHNICDDSPAVLLSLTVNFLSFLLVLYIIQHDFVANNEREIIKINILICYFIN